MAERNYSRGNKTPLKISTGRGAKPSQPVGNQLVTPDDLVQRVPKAPKSLPAKEQKAVWRSTCQVLMDRGLLASTDLTVVELFAWTTCNLLSARAELDKTGHLVKDDAGRLIENPLRKVVAGDQGMIIKLAKEMGLTPRARLEIDALTEKVRTLKLANATETPVNELSQHLGAF
jgi:P27 family predicted phage terminase small subunit